MHHFTLCIQKIRKLFKHRTLNLKCSRNFSKLFRISTRYGTTSTFQGRDSIEVDESASSSATAVSESDALISEEEELKDVLHKYRSDPYTYNILLDSPHPSQVPHIVVTLAPHEEEPSLNDIASHNRALQPTDEGYSYWNLRVPLFYRSTCRIMTYEEWVAIYCIPVAGYEYEATNANASIWTKVGPFETAVRMRDGDWEGFVEDLTRVTRRVNYRVVAIEASSKAQGYRTRYDDRELMNVPEMKEDIDVLSLSRVNDSEIVFGYDDCDEESLPDIETDPWFVAERQRLEEAAAAS
ncbi:hypothetical protein BDN70DRAFT_934786 [Pholiota conissans]|uniref:Uncharacterized protein n=1 Tax=Pholiota conissans TaxID=109636 RepID=A0A9P5YZ92_9AGAR|nr:hypothetical protein BDN70DRAFT_934786 [Pholiota conissans]